MTDETLMNRPDRVALGVTLMLLTVFMMSIQEALFKLHSDSFSLWQIFTLRGLLSVPLLIAIALLAKRRNLWRQAFSKWPLMRSVYMTLMFIAMYAALPFLSLSTVAAGIYTAPVFVTILSAAVIGEPVGKTGWLAIATGFIGVLVILQPGSDSFSLWAVLPVLGGFLYALSSITTRARCQGISLPAMALSLNLVLLMTGILFSLIIFLWQPQAEISATNPSLLSHWRQVETSDWQLIILLAILAVAIGMGLAGAYQSAPPATIATFDYSYLVFMAVWDFLFFAIKPNLTTILGIVLIVTAGLLVTRRRA
ncbi:MAG: DMT family transporter [Pseudomonadota bacterium]